MDKSQIIKICSASIIMMQAISSLAQITVNPSAGKTPKQILKEVFVGKGVTISNVEFNGFSGKLTDKDSKQFGTFSNDEKGFPNFFSSGIILCSGNCKIAEGPNDTNGKTEIITDYPEGFECNELKKIVSPYSVNCPAVLEFDFSSVSNHVVFRYVFATEEYPNFSCSKFNDVFGFFVKDKRKKEDAKNIALIPGTNDAVSVNNIHPEFGKECKAINAEYLTMLPAGAKQMQFNGYVGPFTAEADLTPNHIYHIKLAISNVSDRALESAVFIEAMSFNAVDDNGIIINGDGSSPTYSKTDTLSKTSLNEITYNDFIRNGVVDGLSLKKVGNNQIDYDKYKITLETDYDYLFDSISAEVMKDSIIINLLLYNKFCGCYVPDNIPVNIILTPKAYNKDDLARIIIPTMVPIVEKSPWLMRCLWTLIIMATLILLLVYFIALMKKKRFHKKARMRTSYSTEDNYKEIEKSGRTLRKPGLGAWLNRWFNPFVDERITISFTRPKTSPITFVASKSKNRVLMTESSFDEKTMTVPNYMPRPKDLKKKEGEPISISSGTSIEIKKIQGSITTTLGHLKYVINGNDDEKGFQIFIFLLIIIDFVALVTLTFLLLNGL